MNKEKISAWFREIQERISDKLEKMDGRGTFREDQWKRKGGGGGFTRIMENGALIEKGGVNFSAVFGSLSKQMARSLELPQSDFYATGLSIVIHPRSPMVPIIHMNIRYFEMTSGEKWFGGGIDLTPHYIFPEDAKYFHQQLKKICDEFDPRYYPEFKKWADKYFFLSHRNETRGVGGIFYDRLTPTHLGELEKLFAFTRKLGTGFFPIYQYLVERNTGKPYGEKEILWQQLRRGRYVEFNLIHDKGTRFGLQSDGRTESILMSLPSTASWKYDYKPAENSEEQVTLSLLKKNIDWLNFKV